MLYRNCRFKYHWEIHTHHLHIFYRNLDPSICPGLLTVFTNGTRENAWNSQELRGCLAWQRTHTGRNNSRMKKREKKRGRGKRKNKKIRELNSRANKFRLVERCNDKQRCSGASAKPEKSLFPRYGGWVEWSLSARLLYARNSSRYSITILLTMISHSGPSRAPSSVNEPAVTPRDNSILRRSQRAFGGGTAPNRHE